MTLEIQSREELLAELEAEMAKRRQAVPVPPPPPAPAVRPLKILLAEDNPINQKLALALLHRRGHRVTMAPDGLQAVAAFEREGFDLILMDVEMPGLDGLSATRSIREKERGSAGRIPIVAMTAHAMRGDEELGFEAGLDGYLTKPINPDQLYRTIESLAAGRAG